jgi:hypothetical protein
MVLDGLPSRHILSTSLDQNLECRYVRVEYSEGWDGGIKLYFPRPAPDRQRRELSLFLSKDCNAEGNTANCDTKVAGVE